MDSRIFLDYDGKVTQAVTTRRSMAAIPNLALPDT